jgi:hypothetical protein
MDVEWAELNSTNQLQQVEWPPDTEAQSRAEQIAMPKNNIPAGEDLGMRCGNRGLRVALT